MAFMGDMDLAFEDGSIVRLHLAPATGTNAAPAEPRTERREDDSDEALELPPGFGSAEPVSVNGRAAHALTRGGEALADALRPLGGVLAGIHQSFTESARRPSEVTVEFGVTLGSDLKLGVFSGSGEASFTVSATWDFADRPPGGNPDAEEPSSTAEASPSAVS
ncbi:CU044_2847 family protein [Streptomyces sp. SID5606]|uniref:CU044_2847 family protein n=1 Tax=Streptomyces sp. SID5606 TaxID=2690305 RepID=UPI001F484BB9|nr:CU044_2847 family protein [Streptomyces sp. SID5606]